MRHAASSRLPRRADAARAALIVSAPREFRNGFIASIMTGIHHRNLPPESV
jgi:hypothetical protein